jgi:epoxyqueuosine reductase
VSANPIKDGLRARATALDLASLRFTPIPASFAAGDRLIEFIEADRHGDMDWMATHAERRRNPAALWPEARTVIMAAMSYAPDHNPLDVLSQTSNGAISVYAQGRDYHDVLKGRLKQLAGEVARLTGGEVKVFTDTAPLMEKPLAAEAGVGWQGKHTNLVSREHGSWLFLGAILTTAELEPDAAEVDHCGSCQRCLDVCPTKAFPKPYQLDARRCIAYLTIEHKGHIASEFRAAIGNRVFGCDDCLAVCPWNKFAAVSKIAAFDARDETRNPLLAELLALDDAGFRKRFAGTPVKRTGRDRFLRNVLIAAGNANEHALIPAVRALLTDASPLVRAMAVWALGRLIAEDEMARWRTTLLPLETDNHVRDEWNAALTIGPP